MEAPNLKKIKIFCTVLLGLLAITGCDAIDDIFEEDNTQKPDINRGLVLYYTFDDGSANDVSGHSHNGNLQNNPEFISETPNQKGQAVFLNGFKEALINIPYNPIGDSISYSMSLWIKDFTSGDIIKSFDDRSREDALGFSATVERNFQARVSYGNYGTSTFSNYDYSNIQKEGWHLITVCANEKTDELKLYVDGILVDNVGNRYIDPDLIKIQIGSSTESTNSFKIDNFRIYNRCLMAEEVKLIYETERQ